MQEIYDKVQKGVGVTGDDIQYMSGITDNFGINDSAEFDLPTMESYAEHLKNYIYTYKPEARNIDPSIDPNEQHAGPMAQDIEKVAPDCVKETSEGVKVVDGNRLALVNAGLIGDLSRKIIQLERRILDLEEKMYG